MLPNERQDDVWGKFMRKIVLLSCLLATGAVSAADADLEKLVVSGQSLEESLPQKISQYGSEFSVINSVAIRASGAQDVAKALQMLAPGLFIAPKNGAFDYVDASLQGSRPQDILWLVDGVRINNRLYATTSPLDSIPAAIVERIEILKGGQSLFYGTQAVAGVVNIVTHSARSGENEVSIGAQSDGGRSHSGRIGGVNDNGSYLLFAATDRSNGFKPYKNKDFEASSTDRKRGYNVTTMGAKADYAFSDQLVLTAFYQQNKSELDYARPTDNFLTENQRTEDLAYLKLDGRISDGVRLFVKGYYHEWDTRYLRIYNAAAGIELKSNYDYWGYVDKGLNVMAEVNTGAGVDVRLGYDQQNFSGSDDVLKIGRQTEKVQAVFAQVSSNNRLFEDGILSLGGRYNKPEGEGDKFVGHFSGSYNLNEQLSFHTSLGTSFRLPTAYELYAIDSCCTQGNSDLEPETGKNINLGGEFSNDALQASLSVFAREVDNLIKAETQGDSRVFANSDDQVSFKGAEANLHLHLTDEVTFNANHVYSRAVEKGETKQINLIPLNNTKLSLIYDALENGLRVSVNANRVGSLWDEKNSRRINYGNYTLVDLSIQKTLDEEQKQTVTLSLENVTDQQYASGIGSAKRDGDDRPYVYEDLGTPFTAKLSYSHKF